MLSAILGQSRGCDVALVFPPRCSYDKRQILNRRYVERRSDMTNMEPPETVKLELQPNGIAHLLLNRPSSNNALDKNMVQGLVDALAKLRDDPAVRGVVLRGCGKHFCAGVDL